MCRLRFALACLVRVLICLVRLPLTLWHALRNLFFRLERWSDNVLQPRRVSGPRGRRCKVIPFQPRHSA